jgi:hypothetical protein
MWAMVYIVAYVLKLFITLPEYIRGMILESPCTCIRDLFFKGLLLPN